ncbi:MAG: hypothetical protein ABR562_02625 [Thermoplasmatota archaeon]
MLRLRRLPGLVAVALLLLVPTVVADPSPPEDLHGSYSITTRNVSLTWQPPDSGVAAFTYRVWRDNTSLGSTGSLSYTDAPGNAPDPGYVYLVTASPPGNPNNVGMPAVVGVSTLDCEVASVATSWNYPYLYIHLHEECMGGLYIYDKHVTWQKP